MLIVESRNDEPWVRLAVQRSRTEPKIKGYIEIRLPATGGLTAARAVGAALAAKMEAETTKYLQHGPN